MPTLSVSDELLLSQLERDEGYRQFPYRDTKGKETIGIGRNIQERGISKDEAHYLLANDVSAIYTDLLHYFPWVFNLDLPRQRALVNMGMMGVAKLLGFKLMMSALQNGAWTTASNECMSSDYAKEVGVRASRIAHVFLTGTEAPVIPSN